MKATITSCWRLHIGVRALYFWNFLLTCLSLYDPHLVNQICFVFLFISFRKKYIKLYFKTFMIIQSFLDSILTVGLDFIFFHFGPQFVQDLKNACRKESHVDWRVAVHTWEWGQLTLHVRERKIRKGKREDFTLPFLFFFFLDILSCKQTIETLFLCDFSWAVLIHNKVEMKEKGEDCSRVLRGSAKYVLTSTEKERRRNFSYLWWWVFLLFIFW